MRFSIWLLTTVASVDKSGIAVSLISESEIIRMSWKTASASGVRISLDVTVCIEL